MEAPAQAQKQYRTAAYVRLSVEDSGKPGADTIEGQKNLLLRFIEDDPTLTLYGLSVFQIRRLKNLCSC